MNKHSTETFNKDFKKTMTEASGCFSLKMEVQEPFDEK